MKKQESGRSMVEMLAVLTIIGILSIGGYAGYTLAIKRIYYSKILNVAINLAGQGTGGKSYSSLAGAGMEKVDNIDMALSENGVVCLLNFTGTSGDLQGFRNYTSQYVKPNTSAFYVKGVKKDCVLQLQIGKKRR
ncbi:MAG: prepilin-type N-terminal cleavage/methylation domain-containing protein [Alphaproteobacteria bacterium]|nr:prepilin-type N-terminal cleavage/methylation domain-containing protein [Alphaproteobacteria bacterium]